MGDKKNNNPKDPLYWTAYKSSKEKNYPKAIEEYTRYLSIYPQDVDALKSLCWAYYFFNAEILKDEITFGSARRFKENLFKALKRMRTLKSEGLYSLFLVQVIQFIDKTKKLDPGIQHLIDYLKFLDFWGIENLKEADWIGKLSPEGKPWEALAVKAAKRAGKLAASGQDNDPEKLQIALNWVEAALERAEEDIWLNWYKTKILRLQNKPQESEKYLKTVLTSKASESWVWHFYAGVLRDSSNEHYFAALAKAVSLIRDEEKSRRLRLEFAEELAKREFFPEAKNEVLIVQEVTSKLRLRPLSNAETLMRSPWFDKTEIKDRSKQKIEELIEKAENLIYADIPWQYAVLGDAYQNKSGKNRGKIYSKAESFSVPESRKEIKGLLPGTPISIKIMQGADVRSVFKIEPRNGNLWDILDSRSGVVDSVNLSKNCFHVVLTDLTGVVLNVTNVLAKRIKVGDSVQVYFALGKSGRPRGVHWEFSESKNPSLLKEFDEEVSFFDKEKGFGFTESGIFLQGRICKAEFAEGDTVRGKAVKSYNQKKEEWSWKAFELELCPTNN